MPEPQRARPKPTPETQHFWDGTNAGELRLQRCNKCAKAYFPPRPFCPACGHREVTVFKASGKGFLYSYVIHHRPVPGFTPPYSIAVVGGIGTLAVVAAACALFPELRQVDRMHGDPVEEDLPETAEEESLQKA